MNVNVIYGATVFFMRPSSDGTYYGMVMSRCLSFWVWIHPSICLSIHPSVTVLCTFLLHILTYLAQILHLMYKCTIDQVRVSSINVNHWKSYTSLLNLEYRKYAVFHTFLLHALTYWTEILHITLFYCTTDQVWVSTIFVGVTPFWNIEYWKYTVLRTFLLHLFTHWAVILYMTLFLWTSDQVWVSSICVNFCKSTDPFGT